ncbi:hypothetical protein Tco_1194449 [Tanacetum coccineum]
MQLIHKLQDDKKCMKKVEPSSRSRAIEDIINIGSFVEALVLNHYVLVRKILLVVVDGSDGTERGYQGRFLSEHAFNFQSMSASTSTSNTGYLFKIERLTGTNFSKWRDQVKLTLGVMDVDHALLIDPPAALTATSTADQKRAYEQWE